MIQLDQKDALDLLEAQLLKMKLFDVDEIDEILLEIEDGEFTATEIKPNIYEIKTNRGYEFTLNGEEDDKDSDM
jgi:hypothetical protein